MSTPVDYILGLKDQMSSKIDNATGHIQKMEGALGGVHNMIGKIGAAFGIGFGLYQIGSFVKGAVEQYHELEQSQAKVEANLTSTGEKAGMGMDELKNFAKELSSHIQATRGEVTDMQSQLLTFPAITKDVFQQSMSLVADIAKQTNHGLSETAIMYGKALNDPIKGLMKMMRYGVMFTDQEKEKITALEQSGHLIESQKAMMDAIAHSGYAGVAEKMFNADPLAKFNKSIEETQLTLGEVSTDLIKSLTPALISFMEAIKSSIEWMKQHWELLKNIGIALGAALIAYKALQIVPAVMLAIENATVAAAMGTTSFGAALTASLGPLALVAVAVGVLVGLYKALSDNINDAKNSQNEFVPEANAGEKRLLDSNVEYLKKKGYSNYDAINNAKDQEKTKLTGYINQLQTEVDKLKASKQFGDNWDDVNLKGHELALRKSQLAAVNDYGKSLLPVSAINGKSVADKKDGAGQSPKTKAEGQKTINIHIAYNAPLIKDFTISTTNIKEGLGSLKEKVTAILTGATHDSLIVADY